MTHLKLFEKLLREADLNVIQSVRDSCDGTVIEVHNSGESGYSGFFSSWIFDKDGRLIEISHWE